MAQNINSMLGGMPDDIEKGGMVIYILNIMTFFNVNITLNCNKMLCTIRPRNTNHLNISFKKGNILPKLYDKNKNISSSKRQVLSQL